jgi:hypothetical protein
MTQSNTHISQFVVVSQLLQDIAEISLAKIYVKNWAFAICAHKHLEKFCFYKKSTMQKNRIIDGFFV